MLVFTRAGPFSTFDPMGSGWPSGDYFESSWAMVCTATWTASFEPSLPPVPRWEKEERKRG